ncbi:MAG TPA: acyl-CoA dehydrogenase family protein [Streptosporangiaceae bacterium]|nr:acyl-CoA dehydrogenase family protein [Streptosporangiaceae bacterium]
MNFTQNESQRELAALTRTILGGLTPERLAGADAGGDRFDPALWASLAGAGVLAAGLPESMGGAGLGLLEQCSVLTELGRAVAPVPYLASIVLGAGALAAFGTPDQRRRWAAPAGRGELILTAALPEEDGDDPRAPSARAERVRGDGEAGGGWLLSGVKTAVPAAPLAAQLLVPAATADGATVFLVTPGDEGVTVERQLVTGGDSAGRVTLDGVRLRDDRVLGRPAPGRDAVEWLVAHGTVGLCALQLGVVERTLELTSAYARDRVQFGRPIGSFQAVTQRLADAYIDVEAVRLTMWQAAWKLAAGLPAGAEVATAKFWAADAGHRVAHTAVHVHGGVGIDMDYPLHRYFAAATRAEFALGGATSQLRRIGAALARDTPEGMP